MLLCINIQAGNLRTHMNDENSLWRKRGQMQPMRLCICSGRQFEEIFEKNNFASIQAGDLSKHLKTPSGEKLFKCNQCYYASVQAGNLRTHLKTHSGEKTHKCNQCYYASVQAGNLGTHLNSHMRKAYKCNKCDFVSVLVDNLRRQLKKA